MLDILVLGLSTVASVVTGMFVFARNPRSNVNRVYGFLTICLTLLSAMNYLSLQTNDRLFYVRAVVCLSTLVAGSLYYFVILLSSPGKPMVSWRKVGIYLTVAVALLDMTPFVFGGLRGTVNPVPVPRLGAGLFVIHLVAFLAASLILIFRNITQTRQKERSQYILLLTGVLPIFFFAPVTGFVLPILFRNAHFIVITPLYGVIFTGLVGYAIIKHGLFDVQFFVVRTVAYVTTIFTISIVFVAPALWILEKLVGFNPSMPVFMAMVLIGVLSLYVLQYLRHLFDVITTKVFFRGYHDPQDVLDRLSDVLVRTADIGTLQQETSEILREALGPLSVEYALFANRNSAKGRMASKIVKHLNDSGHPLEIIETDTLTGDNGRLSDLLSNSKVAIAIRLHTTHEDLGFLLLGYKQSGQSYSVRDRRLLSVAADEIAISLQNALRFQEIQRFNITLQERIDDATRKLRRTNQRLRELDETKDDFISMASHQLRTPLTSVKGYLSLVLEGDAGKLNETQAKMLRQAFSSSQRMVFLITDLLNISRLKTGKFEIDAKPVDLSALVQEEIEQLSESAEAKQIKLSYTKPATFPKLMLDDTKIRQVVMNYIDNALYYTPVGGHIDVELTEKPATVELRVTDSGIGVPRSEQPHLFTKFYRATNARKTRPDGTGLGLFMAKKAITAQGGSVVFSSREGHGSTFGFLFSKNRLKVPDNATAVPHSLTSQIDADVAADKKKQKQPA